MTAVFDPALDVPTATTFAVPDPGLSREEQVAHYERERVRLIDYITAQLDIDQPDLAGLVAVNRSTDPARRKAGSRGLPPMAGLASQEIARRTERALHEAVEIMRERGWLVRRGTNRHTVRDAPDGLPQRSLTQYGLRTDIMSNGVTMWRLGSMIVDAEVFDQAIARGRVEGNLSRPFVESQIVELLEARIGDRAEYMRSLAGQGLTSQQIAGELGVSEEYIRKLSRRANLEIPGDHVTRRQRRATSRADELVDQVIQQLEGIAEAVGQIDPASVTALDWTQRNDAAQALQRHIIVLRRLHKVLRPAAENTTVTNPEELTNS